MIHARRTAVAFMMLLPFVSGCVRRTVIESDSTLAPSLVIERFLRAANANDLDTMAKLFGTKEGPFDRMGSKKDNDDRMFTFATVLRHTDFRITGEGDPVSGRREEAKNIMVDLSLKDGKVTLPFRLVKYKSSWLIEDLCFPKLTNPRLPCGG